MITQVNPQYPEVYNVIVEILCYNGFYNMGDRVVRPDTGCEFSFDVLNEYETVVDFQLDWPYSI